MKKILIMLLSFSTLLTLSACFTNGGTAEDSQPGGSESKDNNHVVSTAPSDEESASIYQGKALVFYFSCTGNTETVAKEIAGQTGADIYEIVPEQPYTAEDINYSNDNCRANREMNDDSARPAISGSIENFSDYDVLYIGYPIWWGTMPRILNTFFDTYDFSGKTILPFCTSGGSGISVSVSAIQEAEPHADIKEGLQLSTVNNAADRVAQWLEDNDQ